MSAAPMTSTSAPQAVPAAAGYGFQGVLPAQTFEQALFRLFMDGKISQEEAMANADSATNMLWLINQATAGDITGQAPEAPSDKSPKAEEKKESILSPPGSANTSFSDIKIDATAG